MKRAFLALVLVAAGCGVQPTDPIPGSNATGALIYLIRTHDNTLTPILRPSKYDTRADSALTVLADTPAEPGLGVRNEVPQNAGPMSVRGSTVTLRTDVNALSTLAALQIACTAAAPGPVTLVGGGQTRGPLTCPG